MANAANRKAVESARDREKRLRKQEAADLVALMGTAEGRRTVWRFLTRAQVFGSAFSTNAMQQSHTIGWQDAGKWWLAEIEAACPEKYAVMANEARRAAKEAELAAQSDEEHEHEH